jgi:hypothetical protein
MTAQTTYETDDGQLAQEHDELTLENNPREPDAELAEPDTDTMAPDAELAMAEPDLAAPEPDLAEPDTHPMAPDAELAMAEPDLRAPEPDLAEPDTDQAEPEDPVSHLAGVAALADQESATSIVSGYPDFTPDGDDGEAEPEMADGSPGSPSLVPVAFTVPESVTEANVAGNTASAVGPWNEIQAMFVDDPRASIDRAAGLVDNRVEVLIQSVRERQRSIQSVWQAEDPGTEELRIALQHYRTFWNSLEDLPPRA